MRTDSTRVSQQAQDEAKQYVLARFKKQFYPDKPRLYEKKIKSAQDAHEAIRPSSVWRTPESIRAFLSPDQFKVYKLIWERFLSSQMASAELATTTVEVTAGAGVFRGSSTDVTFAGYTIVYNRESTADDSNQEDPSAEALTVLPELTKGEEVKLKAVDPKQHFTQPPPRFTEASLVKTLEELGIGRPSTYATTVNTIIDRKYVERIAKNLCPTKLGKAVNALLVEHFGDIVEVGFTADMEANLDKIEDDKVDWHAMLKDFYKPFGETLKRAEENMNKVIILSEHVCPTCGQQMAIRSSRFGQFLGCIGYPECKTKIRLTKDGLPVPEDRPSDELCKTCTAPMLIRYGRYGDYLACSVEECTEQRPIVKYTGVTCPREDCGGDIVEKKSRRGKMFFGCSHYGVNGCTMAFWYPPLKSGGPKSGGNKCPQCDALLLYKTLKRGDQIACSNKECGFAQPVTGQEERVS